MKLNNMKLNNIHFTINKKSKKSKTSKNNNKKKSIKQFIIPFLHTTKINLEKNISCCLSYAKNQYNKNIIKEIQSSFLKDKTPNIRSVNLQLNSKDSQTIILVPIKNKSSSKLIEDIRLAGSGLYNYLKNNNYLNNSIGLLNLVSYNEAFLEGLLLTSYSFQKYKKKKESHYSFKLYFPKLEKENLEMIKNLLIKTDAVFLTRDLVNEPNNKLSVVSFIKTIRDNISKEKLPLKITVLDESQLKNLGMNLLVSVGQGSTPDYKSKLMILEYAPYIKTTNKSKKTKTKKIKSTKKTKRSNSKKKLSIAKSITNPDYVLLGKGVIFDTGGINLKTYSGIHEMKCDMAGAALVSSFIMGYAKMKGKQKVIALIPLAQNAIGNKASISGDVIKAYNGKTVEIINTDAEGRLLLADCLSYASEEYPNAKLIDFATLTGQQENLSCKMFSNVVSNHLPLEKEIIKAGESSQELVVSLPYMKEDCLKYLESDTADLRNVAKKCRGQILTSSVFLGEFIKKTTKWAHLDIAGPTWEMSSIKPYMPGEGSGYGVRLLFKMLLIK